MRAASVTFWISFIAGLQITVTEHVQTTVKYMTIHKLILKPIIRSPLPFEYGASHVVSFNYAFVPENVTVYPKKGWILKVSVDNDNIANIQGQRIFYIDHDKPTGNISVEVMGDNAGRSLLRFHVQDWVSYPVAASSLYRIDKSVDQQLYQDSVFPMYVLMKIRPIDTVFNIVVFLLVVTTNIGMGTQVDLDIVKDQLRRPIAPLIGLFSQFFFMPLTAFGVAVVLNLEPGIALGLFACGCAPGGLASNIFTYLLRGNISLSITMTLVSTLASFGLLPLWLFTLGAYLYRRSDIKIPFFNIVASLFIIIVPTVIGLYMQAKTPRAAAILIKATKLVMAFFMLFMFTVGVYANWWILNLIDMKIFFASAALPYFGFIFGGFAAFVGRRSTADVVTIAVETGIQNTAVPIVLLRMSLSGPEQATSIVVPLISSTLTPIPLVFAVIYMEIQSYIASKSLEMKQETQPEDELRAVESAQGESSSDDGLSTPIDPFRPRQMLQEIKSIDIKSTDSEPQKITKQGEAATSLHQQTKTGLATPKIQKEIDVDLIPERLSQTETEIDLTERLSTEIV